MNVNECMIHAIGACSVTRQLVEWCSLNIQCKRPIKQKQLYLHGPPNTLKSSFLAILVSYCTTFEIPSQEDFLDLYPDPEPELCYFDEFKAGKLTIQWWNSFLQGSTPTQPLTLKQKGKQGVKTSNPPVIIVSNYTLEENWKNAITLNPKAVDPLHVRLLVIEALTPLDLEGFKGALALATYATTPPPVVVSDVEMTNVLSASLTLADNQLSTSDNDLSISPPSSPEEHLPRRNKRSLSLSQEFTPLIDTLMSSNQDLESINDDVLIVESSLALNTTISDFATTVTPTDSYSKFKRLRRTYDDVD